MAKSIYKLQSFLLPVNYRDLSLTDDFAGTYSNNNK
jgi:hypothetical protein